MIVNLVLFFTFLFRSCIHLKYMLKNKIIINKKKTKLKRIYSQLLKIKKYDDKCFVDVIDENDQ